MTVSKVAKFLTHKGGNIGITLAVAAIPLVASAGIAVDYINRNQAQAKVQAAVDAGALAGASMRNASEANIRKAIKDFAESNGVGEYLNNPSALKIEIASNGAITVEAEGRVPTTLSRVLGFEYLEVGARSQALRGESGAEVALVLDNTKSMEEGGKIASLRTAANGFVDRLMTLNDGDPDRIKISIVPYAQYVNVGLGNRNASWIDVEPDKTVTWNDCHIPGSERTETKTYDQDGVSTTGTYYVYDYYASDDPRCVEQTYNYNWEGCVGSRDYPYNTSDSRSDIKYTGPRHTFCPNPITPLTEVKTTLTSAIDALNTNFYRDINTYIPSGLMWGWATLSAGSPYTEAVTDTIAERDGISKHLVLMTDGVNTIAKNELPNNSTDATDDEFKSSHSRSGGTAKTDADTITAELCENIKATGITVYTVAFQVSDAGTQSLLKSCATSPAYYFDADDAISLTSSFETIANKVAAVRLSK